MRLFLTLMVAIILSGTIEVHAVQPQNTKNLTYQQLVNAANEGTEKAKDKIKKEATQNKIQLFKQALEKNNTQLLRILLDHARALNDTNKIELFKAAFEKGYAVDILNALDKNVGKLDKDVINKIGNFASRLVETKQFPVGSAFKYMRKNFKLKNYFKAMDVMRRFYKRM